MVVVDVRLEELLELLKLPEFKPQPIQNIAARKRDPEAINPWEKNAFIPTYSVRKVGPLVKME